MNSVHQNVIKHKVGLLNLAAELGSVSRACKVMGFSRDTFYRYQAAVADGGVEALLDANRKKPNFRNRIEESIETAVAAFALEQPADLPWDFQNKQDDDVVHGEIETAHPGYLGVRTRFTLAP
jgi:hypothetical protein